MTVDRNPLITRSILSPGIVKESKPSGLFSGGSSLPPYLSARSRQKRTKSGLCGLRRESGPEHCTEHKRKRQTIVSIQEHWQNESDHLFEFNFQQEDQTEDEPGKAAKPEEASSRATSICKISTTQG